jgi:hypothetical protein
LLFISNTSHNHQNNYFCAEQRKDFVRGLLSPQEAADNYVYEMRCEKSCLVRSCHKRKEYWTSLPATTEELCCFCYFHDRCSGAGGRPRQKITATSGSRVASDQWALWERAYRRLDVTTSHSRGLSRFGYFHDLSRSLLLCWRARKTTATSGSRVASDHWTLWNHAGRLLDVTTSHNRGTFFKFVIYSIICLRWQCAVSAVTRRTIRRGCEGLHQRTIKSPSIIIIIIVIIIIISGTNY